MWFHRGAARAAGLPAGSAAILHHLNPFQITLSGIITTMKMITTIPRFSNLTVPLCTICSLPSQSISLCSSTCFFCPANPSTWWPGLTLSGESCWKSGLLVVGLRNKDLAAGMLLPSLQAHTHPPPRVPLFPHARRARVFLFQSTRCVSLTVTEALVVQENQIATDANFTPNATPI